LLDAHAPRYAVESDDEDGSDMPDHGVSLSTQLLVAGLPSDVKVVDKLLIASGTAGLHWARGATLPKIHSPVTLGTTKVWPSHSSCWTGLKDLSGGFTMESGTPVCARVHRPRDTCIGLLSFGCCDPVCLQAERVRFHGPVMVVPCLPSSSLTLLAGSSSWTLTRHRHI
jgi:hypothetical protein